MSGEDGDPMAVAARPMGIFRPAPPHPVSGEARRFGPENALSFPVTDARRPRTISPDPFHPSSPHRRAPCRPASHRAPTATLSLPPHGDSTGSRPDPKLQTVHENGASSELHRQTTVIDGSSAARPPLSTGAPPAVGDVLRVSVWRHQLLRTVSFSERGLGNHLCAGGKAHEVDGERGSSGESDA